jgi:hypothetical protein
MDNIPSSKDAPLEKLFSITGALSAVLLILASLIFGMYDYLPPAEELLAFIDVNPLRVQVAGYIGTLSAFFLIWFSGHFYSKLREEEGSLGRRSIVVLAGGICSAMALAVAYAAIITAGARGGVEGGISPVEAVILYDFYGHMIGNIFPTGLAVFIGGTAIVFQRTDMIPARVRWLTGLIAVGLLTPVGYLMIAPAILWLAGLSIWLSGKGLAG